MTMKAAVRQTDPLGRLDEIRVAVRRHGIPSVCLDLNLRLVNRLFFLKILSCFSALCGSRESRVAVVQGGVVCAPATGEQLQTMSLIRDLDLPRSFVDEAWSLGHECFVASVDGTPACYCWFSSGVTALIGGLEASFPAGHRYAYKAFTRPAYRGRGLLPLCCAAAMRRYAAEGCQALVTVIERNNFSSIHAFERCGFTKFGTVLVVRAWKRTKIVRDRGCTRFGFEVQDNGRWY
jgi:ribosomal protein S18 acetylase RimI-like enzyme